MRSALLALALIALANVGPAGATGDAARAAARSYTLLDVYGAPRVAALAWSPDGRRLYAAGTDDLLRVFDARDLSLLARYPHDGAWASHVAPSPDGRRVAVGDVEGTVTIRDALTGEVQVRFGGGGRPVTGLGWTGQGEALGVAWLHGPMRVVDTFTGRPVETMGGPGEWFGRADFNAAAGLVAAGGRGGVVRVWELRGGRTVAELDPGTGVQQVEVEVSPGGSRVVTLDEEGVLRVWDVPNRRLLHAIPDTPEGGLAFTADGQRLLLSDGARGVRTLDPTLAQEVSRWEAPPRWTGLPVEPDDAEEAAARGEVRAHRPNILAGADAAVSPDGRLLAEGWGDTLRIWDLSTGAVLASLDTGLAAVTSLDFSPAEGGLLAYADRLGRVHVRAPEDGGARRAMLSLPGAPARRLDFSSDGRWLAIAGPDAHVRAWEVLAGTTTRTLFGHEGEVTDVAFSPQDQLASASVDGTMALWDIETRQRSASIAAEDGGVARVAFSPDGRRLAGWAPRPTPPAPGEPPGRPFPSPRIYAASPGGGVVATPDLQHAGGAGAFSPDGKRLYSSRDSLEWLRLPEGPVEGLAPGQFAELELSPDGLLLAGADRDGSVDLIDPLTGRLLLSLPGHTGRVNAVAFSADGRLIASGSEDGTVRVWRKAP